MPPIESKTYRIPQNHTWKIIGLCLGGAALVVMAILGFILNLVTDPGVFAMHTMTTLPVIIAISLFTSAWNLSKAPEEICVGEEGLSTVQNDNVTTYPWDQVGVVVQVDGGTRNQKYLDVKDTRGKPLIRIPKSMEGYDELAAILQRQIADINPERAESLRKKGARWQGAVSLAVGAAFLAGAVFMFIDARSQAEREQLLAEQSVETTAPITRRFLAPNGVTTRVEFEVLDESGATASHNVEVTPEHYEILEFADATEIPIRTVPGRPDATVLVEGQVIDDTDSVTSKYLFMFLAIGLSIFLLGAGTMLWMGWDFVIDPETKTYGFRKAGSIPQPAADVEAEVIDENPVST